MSSTQRPSPASRYSWAALWLGLAALALLGMAGVVVLPVVFESSPGERAEALSARSWPALGLAVAAGLAAVASWRSSRRATR